MAEEERPYGTPHPDAKKISAGDITQELRAEGVSPQAIEIVRSLSHDTEEEIPKSGGPSSKAVKVVNPWDNPEEREMLKEMGVDLDVEGIEKIVDSETLEDPTQLFVDSMIKFGFNQEEIANANIDSPFTAFKHLLNYAGDLEGNLFSLKSAKEKLEKEKQEKQKSEEKFMRGLERAVDDVFFRLTRLDDSELRKNMADGYKLFILNTLSNKFNDEGYTAQDTSDGLKVKFSDINVALQFNESLPKLREQQYDEIFEKYVALSAERDVLVRRLTEEGVSVSDTQVLEGVSDELALRQKKFLEIRISGKDKLEAMDKSKVVAKYIELSEDLENIKFEMRGLEGIFPGIKERKSARDKLSHSIQEMTGVLQKSAGRVQEYQSKVEETEAKVRQQYEVIFERFELLGDYLRSKGVVCQVGHTKLNGKSLDDCVAAVENEFDQLNQTVNKLVEESADMKAEYTQLRSFCDVLKNLFKITNVKNAKLKEELERVKVVFEEEKARETLEQQIIDLREVFTNYIADSELKQVDYSVLGSRVVNISMVGLINHYLGFLDESLALVRAELASFEEVSNGFVDINVQKQELADQYGHNFDALAVKVGQLAGDAEQIKERGRLEEEFKKFRKESNIKFKELATIEKYLTSLYEDVKEYRENKGATKEEKDIIRKKINVAKRKFYLKDAAPEDEGIERDFRRMDELAGWYESFDALQKKLVEAVKELNPGMYKGRVSKTKQLKKATDLIESIDTQISELNDQEATNQKILALPEYQSFVERLSSLALVGEILGYHIEEEHDIINALENEKKHYTPFIDAHRRYQDDKNIILSKLRPVETPATSE